MRRFLRNIVIFSAIIVALLCAGELVVRNMPTSYSYKNGWILSRGSDVSTLILGSSHTYYGLRPDCMADSVFNLANVSQNVDYDFLELKHYASQMPNLRRIIIPISYFTYRDPEIEEIDRWAAFQYKIRMKLPRHSDLSIYNFQIFDFDTYSAMLRNLVIGSPSNLCDSLGFGLGYDLSKRARNWKEGGPSRAARHTRPRSGRYEEVLREQTDMIRWARDRGIETVIITTPVWATYRNALEPCQLEEMYRGIARLSELQGVRYFDFLTDDRFREDDFYDSDHLSDIGATKLSRILADTLLKSNSHLSARRF